MIVYRASPRLIFAALIAAAGARDLRAQATFAWRFSAPEAASAWFQALDDAHLRGPGRFAYYRTPGTADSRLARTLAASGQYEILHFVPLYYPTATRAALARALRSVATSQAAPSAPRAAFLEGALTGALRTSAERAPLAELAAAVEAGRPPVIPPAAVERWQRAWNERFAAALAPFLRAERLDGGVVMVAAALGPEGRLFAARPADRADNIVAVGTFDASPAADAPVFALVRELCFPLVSRAAEQSPALKVARNEAARRTSEAAVRCGAELLDRFAPAEAAGYRGLWRQLAAADGATDFDTLFPPDPVLAPRIRAVLNDVPRQP